MDEPLTSIDRLLTAAKVPYAVIGAHAVNVWVAPRFTADVDVTVQAGNAELGRLRELLESEGFRLMREHGAELPSGPDFLRFVSGDGILTIEIQTAKTAFQRSVIARAVDADGIRIASVEDLIIMKLIADRAKDQIDLTELVQLQGLNWNYVEDWAREWDVVDRLRRFRSSVD